MRSRRRNSPANVVSTWRALRPSQSVITTRSRCQGITVAVHRVDEAGLIGLRLDLAPQAGNGMVYRAGRRGIVGIAPHTAQQLAAMDDAAGARRQEPQQLELPMGEVQRLSGVRSSHRPSGR